jgi:hypothetical protein
MSGARPINPFLANDPNAKARRLARALISDLISYFPEKKEEGLRKGTLKDLFSEEIKKSYQEFVDQIGREFAESTTLRGKQKRGRVDGGKRAHARAAAPPATAHGAGEVPLTSPRNRRR